jgi:hypothetical protein
MIVEQWIENKYGDKDRQIFYAEKEDDIKKNFDLWFQHLNFTPEDFGFEVLKNKEEKEAIENLIKDKNIALFKTELYKQTMIELDNFLSSLAYTKNLKEMKISIFSIRKAIKETFNNIG